MAKYLFEGVMKYSVETEYMKLWKEQGVIYCIFTPDLDMNIEVAKYCVAERIAFSNGRSYPCLINMQGIKSFTKEARDYMAVEGSACIKAGALVVNTPLSRMLGNMFLAINKPAVPTKLFTDEKQAEEWLQQYK